MNPPSTVLYDVAAPSEDDAWAVGLYPDEDSLQEPLTEHWDGTKWSFVPAPSPGDPNSVFFSVTALSPRNIWAVGATSIYDDPLLAEHSFGC